MTSQFTRRDFSKSLLAAGAVSPLLLGSAKAKDANGELTIAAIGVGGSRGKYKRGAKIARDAAKFGKMVAVCDVDDLHAAEFNGGFQDKLHVYKDYRKLLENEKVDIVTIGTPDHWHANIAIAALRAGCDVYCEKPLTLTIDEGKRIRKVVEETGKVFQVGTQQRSEYGSKFLKAVAIARSGRLGTNLKAFVGIGGGPSGGPYGATAAPKDLDWDLWLGPAPKVEYTKERSHATFRWWLEYSGGKMTDWGAHNIDIAMWALGLDDTGPDQVTGTGKFPSYLPEYSDPVAFFAGEQPLPNGYNSATTFDIDLAFANNSNINVQPSARGENGNGVLIEGDKGRIFVNRGKLVGKPIEEMSEAENKQLDDEVLKLYNGRQPGSHMKDFFQSVADRSKPISDVWSHHRIMTACHLCNLVLLLDRKLKWDPKAEQFIGDDQANALLARPQRKGFEG